MSARRKKKETARPRADPASMRYVPVFLALLAATLVAYRPAWFGGLLWDDAAHLTDPELQSWAGLWRIWFDLGATQQYYPVVHSAFWWFHRLWGDATVGYHLANIVLHATSATLLAALLTRLRVPGAVLAATLFALHPVQVESVAWMTELKNTLSGVFYPAAALVYLRFDETRQTRPYVIGLALFVLAILSKSVTATLPAALLVVFWWKRGTIEWHRDVRPLAPWLGLGLTGGFVTAWVERTYIGAAGAEFHLSAIERVLVAGRALWFYLGTLAWPAGLTFSYPRWIVDQTVAWQYAYPAAALAFGAILWFLRGRSRAPLAALLIFAGTLAPALGFVNVYPFRYSFVADHFQYLACMAVFALAAASAATTWSRFNPAPFPVAGIAIGAAVVLGVLTWRQSGEYLDAETLWRATLDRNPSSRLAHNNLGIILMDQPDGAAEAVAHLDEAIRLTPASAGATDAEEASSMQCNLALALVRAGDLQRAPAARDACFSVDPSTPRARQLVSEIARQLGVALFRANRREEALATLQDGIRIVPADVTIRQTLASALVQLERIDDAIAVLKDALSAGSGLALAAVHNDLGVALALKGQTVAAAAEFREALRVRPDFAEARANLARAEGGGRP